MVLRRWVAVLVGLLGLAAGVSAAQKPAPVPGEVTLPLGEYVGLLGKVERLEKERAEAEARRETPLAAVVEQSTTVVWGDEVAELSGHFEALIQGAPDEALLLPFAGFAASADVVEVGAPAGSHAAGSVTAGSGGFLLVTPVAGRYAIDVRSRAATVDAGGIRRLTLPPVVAPVAEIKVDLPSDLAWSAPGGVLVEESTVGHRRVVRLAAQRGAAQTIEVQRRLDDTEAEKLLAQSVVLTLFQLRPEGLRRNDVVLYEVSRGGLADLTVELPAGLGAEQVATDEGDVVPVLAGRRLTVHRKRQLQGVGYLVLTSTPAAGAALPAASLTPAGRDVVEVRGRYLAFASSVAADAQPLPAASWTRVDVSDLPADLNAALAAVDWAAAWRLASEAPDLAFRIVPLPPAPHLPTIVRERDTLSLLTVDGTVLHRDRFTLEQQGPALDVTLPAGATLWSIVVDGEPVRAVERGGTLSIPLALVEPGKLAEIELVTVVDRHLTTGRSELALDLPQVAAPVISHQWRLLLPEGPSYRFTGGELQPAADEEDLSTLDRGASSRAGLALTVVDDKGSPLPGATVTLNPPGGGEPTRLITSERGRVQALNMPSGHYEVTVELAGFAGFRHPDVELVAHRIATLELTLSVAVEETIAILSPVSLSEQPGAYSASGDEGGAKTEAAHQAFRQGAKALKAGVVSGVKPLPIAIPESGKALLLTGVLPPRRVTVTLAVQGKN